MDKRTKPTELPRCVRWLAGWLATVILIPVLQAQPADEMVQGRFLFVFDTAKAMKPRIEGVHKTLDMMLATSLNGQLHSGDSIGVWTFNQSLRPADYPLQTWNADQAVLTASNMVKFVDKQHYTKSTRLEALQPLLNEVVHGSERLTVLIFCDGEGKLTGTPYDAGINKIFSEKHGEQKKAKQPFVVVLRSQRGEYVGCTIGLPPQPVTYPPFPPLPKPPPPPPPKATNAPAPPATPAPVIIPTAPLIITGTKSTASPVPATNPPPAVSPQDEKIPSNAPSRHATATVKTNLAEQTAVPTNEIVSVVAAAPVAPASSSQKSGNPGNALLLLAAGLLGAAIALGVVFWLRPRRKDVSLITRSLNDRD